MADYTDNLHLILPGDDDYALVENLTDDFQAIDDFAGDVVKVYDPTTTHSKREYCLYQNHIYKCNAFINTPEAFDPSHWDRVILGDEVRNNNSYISNLQSGLAIVQDGDTATKAITEGQYVLWKSSMRYAKANISVGETLSGTNLGLVTTYNGALNRISDQIAQIVAANAGSHNSIYRGKYLGSAVTSAQWAAIKNGTFDDLFVGDYWTIGGVNWRIAGFNYWYNTGDTNCTKNHAVIVPDSNLASCAMNSTNIPTGAYVGSDFYTGSNSNTGKSTAVTTINNAFGSAHILSHRELLANATSNGAPSGWAWYDSTVELMNEQMVYGSRAWGNQAGAGNGYDVGIDKSQLPLFQHDHSRICNSANWWLRGVVSGSSFAFVSGYGSADADYASYNRGVRPAFGIYQS